LVDWFDVSGNGREPYYVSINKNKVQQRTEQTHTGISEGPNAWRLESFFYSDCQVLRAQKTSRIAWRKETPLQNTAV